MFAPNNHRRLDKALSDTLPPVIGMDAQEIDFPSRLNVGISRHEGVDEADE